MKDAGFASIIRGNKQPTEPLVKSAQAGEFHTKGYSECLIEIQKLEEFTETDLDLIKEIQNLRNALAHFAADVDVADIRKTMAWLLIRVLAMFAAGEDRDIGEFQTYRSFLDPDTFSALINFGPYRAEAFEAANDNPDSESVFRCWECEADTLSLRSSDTYFCYCCGLTVITQAAAFADCMICGAQQGVCYDPLNTTNGNYRGRCLHCHTFIWLQRCNYCGSIRMAIEQLKPEPCEYCSE